MARRFVADGPCSSSRVDLDGLVALYHRPSGQTHILASPAPQILEALAEMPMDAEGLLTRLAERFELDEGAGAVIADRLAELEAAGLVRLA